MDLCFDWDVMEHDAAYNPTDPLSSQCKGWSSFIVIVAWSCVLERRARILFGITAAKLAVLWQLTKSLVF